METYVPPAEGEEPSSKIIISDEWSNAAMSIASGSTDSEGPPMTVVCGPKSSGKSTFSRHLLNVLLSRYERVAYLDTDVGQPEFTAPGCLSLLICDKITPDLSIVSLKTPERCYFFGDVSPKRNPEAYSTCVYALFDYYRKEYRSDGNGNRAGRKLPLIVNTGGWVKGIGYHTLVNTLNYISPTYVVRLKKVSWQSDLPDGPFWANDGNVASVLKVLDRPGNGMITTEPREIRELRLIAYFKQCLPSDAFFRKNTNLADALASLPPYQVSISSVKIRHLHCQVPSTELLYSLNATIVGLAVEPESSAALPKCVGLGIVRGIDTSKNLLYVITPVPPSVLQSVDLLLQGFVQIPAGLLKGTSWASPYLAANVISKF